MAKVTKREEVVKVTLEMSLDEAEQIAGAFAGMVGDIGYEVFKAFYNARISDSKYYLANDDGGISIKKRV